VLRCTRSFESIQLQAFNCKHSIALKEKPEQESRGAQIGSAGAGDPDECSGPVRGPEKAEKRQTKYF
jgi:hypothetical protein